jgi:hypothetical protein
MAVARASVNVMKCGVRVRWGTRQHNAVASRHPRWRRLRGVDDDDDDDDNDDDTRLPMQLPLTLRLRRL